MHVVGVASYALKQPNNTSFTFQQSVHFDFFSTSDACKVGFVFGLC